MRIVLAAAIMLSVFTGRSFAGGWLYLEDNPEAAWKIIDVDSRDIKGLKIKDSTTFIFDDTAKFRNVAGGDVLVAGACKEFPDGFVRKAVTVRHSGNKVIIETIEGTLEDMLKGRLAANIRPAPAASAPDKDK